MPDTVQPALPGVAGPEYVQGVIDRIRALYAEHIQTPGRPASMQGWFWDCVLNERDRRYFLNLAKLPAELAALPARELTQGQLFAVFDAYQRLSAWITELGLALHRGRKVFSR